MNPFVLGNVQVTHGNKRTHGGWSSPVGQTKCLLNILWVDYHQFFIVKYSCMSPGPPISAEYDKIFPWSSIYPITEQLLVLSITYISPCPVLSSVEVRIYFSYCTTLEQVLLQCYSTQELFSHSTVLLPLSMYTHGMLPLAWSCYVPITRVAIQ